MSDPLYLAKSDDGYPALLPQMANRHGLITGATGTGTPSEKLLKRIAELGLEGFAPYANTVAFWDVFGQGGVPVRATVSDMGPLLLARLLNLNDTQAGVLQLVFKIADDQGLLLP